MMLNWLVFLCQENHSGITRPLQSGQTVSMCKFDGNMSGVGVAMAKDCHDVERETMVKAPKWEVAAL